MTRIRERTISCHITFECPTAGIINKCCRVSLALTDLSRKKGEMEGCRLPRSIRWRLQLGLLSIPEQEEDTETLSSSVRQLVLYNLPRVERDREAFAELLEQYRNDFQSSTIELLVQQSTVFPSEKKKKKKKKKKKSRESNTKDDGEEVDDDDKDDTDDDFDEASLDPLTAAMRQNEKRDRKAHHHKSSKARRQKYARTRLGGTDLDNKDEGGEAPEINNNNNNKTSRSSDIDDDGTKVSTDSFK